MEIREIVEVIEASLECTVYFSPSDTGLSYDELLEIGQRLGIRKGDLSDALRSATVSHDRADGRIDFGHILPHKFLSPGMLNPDYRPLREMDFICSRLRDIVRDEGAGNAKINNEVVIAQGIAAGYAEHDMRVALKVCLVSGRLQEKEGSIHFRHGYERNILPGESERQMRRDHLRPGNATREKAYSLVKDVIARRTDGRPKSIDVHTEFANQLEKLGYKAFRLWWMQVLAEMKSTNDNSASVAVSVLAAALVEGALTFIVKQARSMNVGLFGSSDWDRPPNTWRIEDLVKAASGGGSHAILDQGTRSRAEALIRNRQRIHAGRMLVDHPSGVADLRPEEAREARATLETVLRKILDWIERHPAP